MSVENQGEHPIFILKESHATEGIFEEAHILTIHGGVTLTMAQTRQDDWISNLGEPVKKTIKKCYAWKRFHVNHYPKPLTG